jgi:hypothetical protein
VVLRMRGMLRLYGVGVGIVMVLTVGTT